MNLFCHYVFVQQQKLNLAKAFKHHILYAKNIFSSQLSFSPSTLMWSWTAAADGALDWDILLIQHANCTGGRHWWSWVAENSNKKWLEMKNDVSLIYNACSGKGRFLFFTGNCVRFPQNKTAWLQNWLPWRYLVLLLNIQKIVNRGSLCMVIKPSLGATSDTKRKHIQQHQQNISKINNSISSNNKTITTYRHIGLLSRRITQGRK